jgi:hypothetical protein
LPQYAPDSTKELGLDAHQVSADVTAGTPPNQVFGAVGTFNRAAINKAAHADKKWAPSLSTPTYHKATVYRWLDDNKVNLNGANTGLFTTLGNSRRFALPNDRTLLYARNDATIHAALDSAASGGKSLAGNSDFAAAARSLDKQHAYSAMMTAKTPSFDKVARSAAGKFPPAMLAKLKALALDPYRAVGIGVTRAGGRAVLVLALVNADARGQRRPTPPSSEQW